MAKRKPRELRITGDPNGRDPAFEASISIEQAIALVDALVVLAERTGSTLEETYEDTLVNALYAIGDTLHRTQRLIREVQEQDRARLKQLAEHIQPEDANA
jgi:GH24 family phage-related lysozyme (muramidase)